MAGAETKQDAAASPVDLKAPVDPSHDWDWSGLSERPKYLSEPEAGAGQASPGEQHVPATEENVFRREGDSWIIVYERESTTVKNLIGMHYIAELLRRPLRKTHVRGLEATVTRAEAQPEAEELAGMTEEQLEEIGLTPSTVGDAGLTLDQEAVQQYNRELRKVEEAIQEAAKFDQPDRLKSLETKKEDIETYLKKSLNLRGLPRRIDDPEERARKRVCNSITRAIEEIEKHLPELAKHLRDSISLGLECMYQPKQPAAWSP